MFLGSLWSLILAASCKSNPTRDSPDSSVRRLIFDNKTGTMCVDFDGPIIIDNIHLLKKVNDSGRSIPVTALNEYVVEPEDYASRVQDLKEADIRDKSFGKIYKNACCKQIKIDLDDKYFNDKDVFLLKLQPLNSQDDLYTEEFVYADGTFEHWSSSHSSHRWYASSWPWIAIGFIILSAILLLTLLRLLCC